MGEKGKKFKRYLGFTGSLFICVISLSLCSSINRIERITLSKTQNLAEANIDSSPRLSLILSEEGPLYPGPDFRQSPDFNPVINPYPGSNLSPNLYSDAVSHFVFSRQVMFYDPEPDQTELFLDASIFGDGFNIAALRNVEEIEMSMLPQEFEDQKTFLKFIENQKIDFHFHSSPWPAHGWISSGFGYRTSPFTCQTVFHKGIDIASSHGTSIYATNRGVVIFSDKQGEYGNTIIIDHGFGFSSLYGHNSINIVKSGDKIERGQLIGYIGNTGRSTAPHLHYEIIKDGRYINPRKYLLAELF